MSEDLVAEVQELLVQTLREVEVAAPENWEEAEQAEIERGMKLHNWGEKAEAFQKAAYYAARGESGGGTAAGEVARPTREATAADEPSTGSGQGGVRAPCGGEIPAAARYPLALWAFNKSAALSRPSPRDAELHYLAYFWLTETDREVATRTAPTYPHGLKYYFSLATVAPGAPYLAPLRTDAPVDVLRRLALHSMPEVPRELGRMLQGLATVSPSAIADLKSAALSRKDYTPAQRNAVLAVLEPSGDHLGEMRSLLEEASRVARTSPTQALGLVSRACGLLEDDDSPESEEILRELTRGASRVGDLGLAGRALVLVYLAAEQTHPGREMEAEGALLQRFAEEVKRAGGGAEGAIGRFLAEHTEMREDLRLDSIPSECPVSAEEAAKHHALGVGHGPNNEEAAACFRLAACIAAAAPSAGLDDFKHYVASYYASSARLSFRRGRWEEAERCYLVFFNLLHGDEALRARIQPIVVPVLKYFLSLSFRARRTLAHVPVDRETSPRDLCERIRGASDTEVAAALEELLQRLEQANPLIVQELREEDPERYVLLADSPPKGGDKGQERQATGDG